MGSGWSSKNAPKNEASSHHLFANKSCGEFDLLGPDLIRYILSFVHHRDMFNVFQVNKTVNWHANHDAVWRPRSLMLGVPDIILKNQTWKGVFRRALQRAWSFKDAKSCARSIIISEDGTSISRTDPNARNPAIIINRSFSDRNPTFQVIIRDPGTWVGVGIVSANFLTSDAPAIGKQTSGFNVAYFSQTTQTLRSYPLADNYDQIISQRGVAKDTRLTFHIDYAHNTIMLLKNDSLAGRLTFSPNASANSRNDRWFHELLYPCISLGLGSVVEIDYS